MNLHTLSAAVSLETPRKRVNGRPTLFARFALVAYFFGNSVRLTPQRGNVGDRFAVGIESLQSFVGPRHELNHAAQLHCHAVPCFFKEKHEEEEATAF